MVQYGKAKLTNTDIETFQIVAFAGKTLTNIKSCTFIVEFWIVKTISFFKISEYCIKDDLNLI